MKRLLIFLMFVPAFCSAEIPLVSPVTIGNLTPADGRTFSSWVMVRMDGDEIAVLDPVDNSFGANHGAIYLFARQGNSWQQTLKLDPPGGIDGPFRGFEFHDDVMVVSIKPSSVSLDGARYRSYVLERVNGSWTQTVQLPDRVTGPVRVRGNWMAVPRRFGIEMFQRLGFANWQSAGELAQEGRSYLYEAFAGPGYSFDGSRILIGTDLIRSVTNEGGGNYTYFQVAALLYQLDASGHWTLAERFVTDQEFDAVIVQPESVSLSGADISILGKVYRDNGYGYWEQTADLSPLTVRWLARMQVEFIGNGMSWMVSEDGLQRDLYVRSSHGFWQPRLRLAPGFPSFLETQGSLAVVAFITPNPVRREPGTAVLSLVDVAGLAQLAHEPAQISSIHVEAASIRPLDTTSVSLWVYSGNSGNAVQSVEYRDSAGAWQPMQPGDGRFDSSSEMAFTELSFPPQTYGATRICFRVTDTAGRQTELLDRHSEPCPAMIVRSPMPAIIHVPDSQPPVLETPFLVRTQLQPGQDNAIYAFADDSSSGEICTGQPECAPTRILGMQFRIDDGVWRTMKPFPRYGEVPTFYSAEMGAAYGYLPPARGLGPHSVCVRALDSFGTVSAPQCVAFEVAW